MKTKTVLLIVVMCVLAKMGFAYDDQETHRKMTEKAIGASNVEDYVISNLGWSKGLRTVFPADSENTIKYWLMEGSKLEDHPNCRASNHFHDPTKTWDSSAMSDEPLWLDAVCSGWKPWYSNITWATGFLYPDGPQVDRRNQYMGWDSAREYFYSALTSTTSADRETNFAKTFQSVGQVMHLLEDMAVPAHVRNDFA